MKGPDNADEQPGRSRVLEIPLESRDPKGSWWARTGRTFGALLTHPHACFRRCPEPVDHGLVLRFLASLRLPPWLVLLGLVGVQHLRAEGPAPITTLQVHHYVDPPLAYVLSVWLLLMVPVGIPVMYFLGGLVAHVGMALTGGASRSIGASMRAVGYSLAPALLAIAVLDLPLYLGKIGGLSYVVVLGLVSVLFLWQAGAALARTHHVSVVRGLMVGLLPVLVLVGSTMGRATLVLRDVPLLPPVSTSPYYVP